MTEQENNKQSTPYIRIIEQPSSKGIRFRYECEGRCAGSIEGATSTYLRKTYPTIKIENYKGPAFIVVSCVSKNPPYYPHPHNLIGKSTKISNGICCFRTESEDMVVPFANMGIQCVTRKGINRSLAVREKLRVDPFHTGYYSQNPDNIDVYCVRLCFQVFIEGEVKGTFNVPLSPVVSTIIYDKKVRVQPIIDFITADSASAAGGTEMCILCDKVMKSDVEVRFSRKENNWEVIAELTPPKIYKQIAIVFKSPKYVDPDITEPVSVRVQLRRISDGETSDSVMFKMMPVEAGERISAKRKRHVDKYELARQIQAEAAKKAELLNLASPKPCNTGPLEPSVSPVVMKNKLQALNPVVPSKPFIPPVAIRNIDTNNQALNPVDPSKPFIPPVTMRNIDPSKPFIPVVTIRNNELNAMRNQAPRPDALTQVFNNYDNSNDNHIQNVQFDHSMQATAVSYQTPETEAVYQPLNSLNESQQHQKSSELASDSLIDDGWIKDLINTIDPNDSSQPVPSVALKNIDQVVPEPVTQFIPIEQLTAQNMFLNGQGIDNLLRVEGQMDQNISEVAPISGSLSGINTSDLIKDIDIELAGTSIDNIVNELDFDHLPPLAEGEDAVHNTNQAIKMSIEALQPSYLFT